MQKQAFIILLMSLVMTSCANMSHFKYILKPEEISKSDFVNHPYETTEKYHFKVITAKSLSDKKPEIVVQIDELYTEYSICMNVTDNADLVRKFVIAVVNSTFRCNYHYGMCNGEYDPKNELIIVSYLAFKRNGTLPLLQHEWAHAYGALQADHSNIKDVIHCIKY